MGRGFYTLTAPNTLAILVRRNNGRSRHPQHTVVSGPFFVSSDIRTLIKCSVSATTVWTRTRTQSAQSAQSLTHSYAKWTRRQHPLASV